MTSETTISVKVEGLSKAYDEVNAVKDVSFEVKRGELFGLIGPDGAGKSTLFRMLTSLLRPDSGKATVQGLDTMGDYKRLRKIIGYMPGSFSLYRDLSVQENLNFFASIFNTTVSENYHLVKDIYVQLEPFRRRRADKLSGGMKQKLALCSSLIHEPEVLFLDEPTTGVDAVSREEFWDMLDRLVQRGITIIVSTPYMDEASRCQRVALMQEGTVMLIDTPEAISASYTDPLFAVKTDHMYQLPLDLDRMPESRRAERFGEFIHLTTRSLTRTDIIEQYLESLGHREIMIKPIKANVEDVFLDLISK